MRLAIEPLHSALGAAVTGIDLAAPMDAALRAELMAAWERHHVLVFRGQRIGDEAQVAFTRQFGELEIFPQQDDRAAAVPEIFRVANTDEAGRILPPDGEHALVIESRGDDRVRLLHYELFRGLLVTPLLGLIGANTRRGFEEMNRALKERAEQGSATDTDNEPAR